MAPCAPRVGVKDERGEHERPLVGHAAGARAGGRALGRAAAGRCAGQRMRARAGAGGVPDQRALVLASLVLSPLPARTCTMCHAPQPRSRRMARPPTTIAAHPVGSGAGR